MFVFFICLTLLSLDLLVVCVLTLMVERLDSRSEQPNPRMDPISRTETSTDSDPALRQPSGKAPVCAVAAIHNQGKRPSQQDNLCVESVFGGSAVLAVVADGMGGLSGGERVSGRIIQDIRAVAPKLEPSTTETVLPTLVERISGDVNRMLGPDGIYKSGSTLLVVLAERDRFSWASVGDSRIYLYRDGVMNKVNVEHNLLTTQWMPEIQAGRMDLKTAMQNPEGKKLTSFIGMGQLKYMDYSRRAIPVKPGDRILLMSDGVFNTLSDSQMAQILEKCTDVSQAASLLENQVLAMDAKGQDNFTAVILGF